MSERLAIIGTGVMGLNHARTAEGLGEHFELSHIVDTDMDRANDVRGRFGREDTAVADTIADLSDDTTDAAIIASPSRFHAEQAAELMRRGVHVLVEKPVALNIEDAEMLKQTAAETDRTLMVGHVELFNPTVHALGSLIGDTPIKSMRFKRLSNVEDNTRLYHDVVNDLMLHDISIAYHLSGANGHDNASVVAAHGRQDTPAHPDPAEAIVYFGDTDAHFRASRAYAGGKVRTIEIETADEVYQADLMSRSVVRRASNEGHIAPDGVFVEDLQSTKYFPTQNAQPLTLEQIHFAQSIQGVTTPEAAGVSIDHALRIMRLTGHILDSITTRG